MYGRQHPAGPRNVRSAHDVVDHRHADRKRRAGALWAYCGYGAWRGLAALGTNCGNDDTRAFCQPSTYRVIEWAPLVGALTGLAVTVVGCWIWPRRNRVLWVTIGYVVAGIGLAVGVSLGSGG